MKYGDHSKHILGFHLMTVTNIPLEKDMSNFV